jgi:hypothetical protein
VIRRVPDAWRPFMHEAELARGCLGVGLQALAKANHMDKGRFTNAFFNLSVGLERLMKLIYLIDFALRNDGLYPSEDLMKKRLGHDLVRLHEEARDIRATLVEEGEEFAWRLPDATLADRIIHVLAEFATSTRYYNLDYLIGAKRLGRDPVQAWADEVGRYLIADYPARLRMTDEEWAADAEILLGDRSVVLQQTESGEAIGTITHAVLHGRRGQWVQKQATFHCAVLARELVEVLWALEDRSRKASVIELPMLHEFFGVFYNPDSMLKGRRTFLA